MKFRVIIIKVVLKKIITIAMWSLQILKLTLGIVSIYIVYLLTSLLNQRIFTRAYSLNNKSAILHFFFYPDLLQVATCFTSFFAGIFYSWVVKKQSQTPIPFIEGCLLGCLYTCRVNCLNYSIFYVQYAIRATWGKLSYLTTILVSVFLSRYDEQNSQKIKVSKIKPAIIISVGAVIFAYYATYDRSQKVETDYKLGYIFMTIALLSKGLFIDNQSFCKYHYQCSSNQLLYTVNLFSAIFSIILLVFKVQSYEAIKFCLQHRQIMVDISLFCLLSTIGQFLIYNLAFSFNLSQNIIPLISMTRNLLSNLIVVINDSQTINLQMIIGLILAYGGMMYEIVDSSYYSVIGTQPLRMHKQKANRQKQQQ